jgi:hypothetical protein
MLKQISMEAQHPDTVDAFNLGFPLFHRLSARFTDEYTDHDPIMSGMGGKAYFVHRGRERRYSGERDFPRGRYWAVCGRMENGRLSDCGTLLGELRAYHSYAAGCLLHMGDTQIAEADWTAHECMDFTGPRRAIPPEMAAQPFLSFTLLPTVITPHLESRRFLTQQWRGAVLHFVYQGREPSRVFDLRTKSALDWVINDYFDTFEAVARKQRETGPKKLRVESRRPSSPSELLSLLAAPEIGGGHPFIQSLGYYLRKHDCNGIVFPAARSNFQSSVSKKGVEDCVGWNYVDLTGASFSSEAEFERIVGRSWLSKTFLGVKVEIAAASRGGSFDIAAKGLRERNLARFHMMQDCVHQQGEPDFGDFGRQLASYADLEPPGRLSIEEYFSILDKKKEGELRQAGDRPDLPRRRPWFGQLSEDYLRSAGRLTGTGDFRSRIVDACLP